MHEELQRHCLEAGDALLADLLQDDRGEKGRTGDGSCLGVFGSGEGDGDGDCSSGEWLSSNGRVSSNHSWGSDDQASPPPGEPRFDGMGQAVLHGGEWPEPGAPLPPWSVLPPAPPAPAPGPPAPPPAGAALPAPEVAPGHGGGGGNGAEDGGDGGDGDSGGPAVSLLARVEDEILANERRYAGSLRRALAAAEAVAAALAAPPALVAPEEAALLAGSVASAARPEKAIPIAPPPPVRMHMRPQSSQVKSRFTLLGGKKAMCRGGGSRAPNPKPANQQWLLHQLPPTFAPACLSWAAAAGLAWLPSRRCMGASSLTLKRAAPLAAAAAAAAAAPLPPPPPPPPLPPPEAVAATHAARGPIRA